MNTTVHPTVRPTEPVDRLATRRVKRLGAAAIVTTLIAALAGLCLVVLDPAAGSTTEAVLGITAATSGLATAALAIGAAVYAQVAGLWSRLPLRLRHLFWIALAISLAHSLWSQLSHLG